MRHLRKNPLDVVAAERPNSDSAAWRVRSILDPRTRSVFGEPIVSAGEPYSLEIDSTATEFSDSQLDVIARLLIDAVTNEEEEEPLKHAG